MRERVLEVLSRAILFFVFFFALLSCHGEAVRLGPREIGMHRSEHLWFTAFSIVVVTACGVRRSPTAPVRAVVGETTPAQQITEPSSDSARFKVLVDTGFGFIDRRGQYRVAPYYKVIGEFSEGLVRFMFDDRWGFLDLEGRVAIAPRFVNVGDFSEGLAPARSGALWGYIDTSGTYVIAPQFAAAEPFSEGFGSVRTNRGWAAIDHSGRLLRSPDFHFSKRSEGMFSVWTVFPRGQRWGYADDDGNVVIPLVFNWQSDFVNGRSAVVFEDLGYGMVDGSGAFVIPPLFANLNNLSEGLAPVCTRTTDRDSIHPIHACGYVDANGNVTIWPRFDSARRFADGRAAVSIDGRWGYIDRDGRVVIPLEFDHAQTFRDGLAEVERFGKTRYIETSGNTIWHEPYWGLDRSAVPRPSWMKDYVRTPFDPTSRP